MKSLLILDDDLQCGALISKFAGRLGINASAFTDSKSFLKEVEASGPEAAAIIDLQMPGKDGIDIVEQIASIDFRGPVFLMSGAGKAMLEASKSFLETSGRQRIAGLLTKPFSMEELNQLLHAEVPRQVRPLVDELSRSGKKDSSASPSKLLRAIRPAFQPQIAAGNRRIIGFEVLARFGDQSAHKISTETALKILRESGKINAATIVLSKRAIDWASACLDEDQHISLNLEAKSIEDDALFEEISRYADTKGILPRQITFEITEHQQLSQEPNVVRRFLKLRAAGHGIAVDDFGVGFSSLRQISDFPFSELKIDREFVAKMLENEKALSIVQSAIQLCSSAGLTSIAEGVESEAIAVALEAMGCDALQGYWISMPLGEDDARKFVEADSFRILEATSGVDSDEKSKASSAPMRIAIVDDEAQVRQTLVRGLTRMGHSCRPFINGQDFIESLDSERFDCCLLDFRMPDKTGIEVLKAIPPRHRSMPVIVFTSHGDVELAVGAMSEGAVDMIEKPSSLHAIAARIEERVRESQQERAKIEWQFESELLLETLSPREKEVASFVSEGMSSKEIGRLLGLSYRTVQAHRANILKKTNARNSSELASLVKQASSVR